MESTEPLKDILDATISEQLGEDFLKELTHEELVEQLIHGDNEQINCYQKFCSFIEGLLVPQEGSSDLIFAPTSRSLRFYRNHFRRQLSDVLFVGVNDPEDPESIIKQYSEAQKLEEKEAESKE